VVDRGVDPPVATLPLPGHCRSSLVREDGGRVAGAGGGGGGCRRWEAG
jgi:hypothetical protein